MPGRTFHPEFRDEQLETNYPFSDHATLLSNTLQPIEPDTFLDASIYVVGLGPGAYIPRVSVKSSTITIYIGDQVDQLRASATFNVTDPPTLLKIVDKYGRPGGILISSPERLAIFQTWPPGDHVFDQAATEFVSAVVIPTPEVGLRGLLTPAGELFVGDVWLVGESGVVLREDDGAIRIDIIGDPLVNRKLCEPAGLFDTPNFLRTINGIPADERGDFKLEVLAKSAAATVLRIRKDNESLKIEVVGERLER